MADILIYGTIKTMAGDGKAAYAIQVYDQALGKLQSVINEELYNAIQQAAQQTEIERLKTLLLGYDLATLPMAKALTMEAVEYRSLGCPTVLISKVAGAPSAANVPDNWDETTAGVWYGCPRFVGQRYIDQASKKVYEAVTLTNSTADWVALN